MRSSLFQKKKLEWVWIYLFLFVLTACAPVKALTVSEVWQNAQALEGKPIRVRGQAVFSTVPYQGLTGCVPGGGGEIKGELALYDEDAPDPLYYGGNEPLARLEISTDSLNCQGNTCQMTCTPFDPHAAKAFEFKGTLHKETRLGKIVLILSELDLDKSFQISGAAQKPMPTGTFQIIFP